MSSPNTPKQPDPILTHSLSWPLAIAALALMASTLWAMYDEFYTKRPWAEYQEKYVAVYAQYLDSIAQERSAAQTTIEARADYAELKKQLDAVTAETQAEEEALAAKLKYSVQPRIDDLNKALVEPKSLVTAELYLIDKAGADKNEALKAKLLGTLASMKAEKINFQVRTVPIPADSAAAPMEAMSLNFDELTAALQKAKDEKTAIVARQGELGEKAGQLRKQMLSIEDLYKSGLTPKELAGIRDSLGNFKVEIKQIHVKDVDLVDRCESCHVGIRQPVNMTAEALLPLVGPGNEHLAKAFAVHPKGAAELLKIHDPERFGCSPCHNGNGIGTTTIEKAHGKNHHWLWPMYDKENTEAGCLQCHQSELKLEHSKTLNAGKELFRHLGCWGCHPRDGFQPQASSLQVVNQRLKDLVDERRKLEKAIVENQARQDDENTPAEAIPALAKEAEQITMKVSSLVTQEQTLHAQQQGLFRESKRVGPNLKNAKAKLKKDWIPVWLSNTKDFRPGTRMPQFRFENEEVKKDVAAFIWQASNNEAAVKQPAGDAVKGKETFEKRGCQACHAVGEGAEAKGGDFAANLSRVGEKANYDFLVHWVQHPDRRLTPYNAAARRDYTPEEAKTLKADDVAWDQAVIMPNLRLSDEEARDVAAYLMTLKHADATYTSADWIEDKGRFESGRKWVKHFGCAGCHEIGGLENEGGIGTDLTKEGSKPLERLDFGLLTLPAEVGNTFEGDPYAHEFKDAAGIATHNHWYDHKGFFKRKLKQPEIFDLGKEATKAPEERLKMPNFKLSEEEITQLTTFLLGSVDSNLPERFYHNPKGAAKDIADGWWVVQKYNCTGCHQIVPGELPGIQKLEGFSGTNKGIAPPNLVGQGARVDPEWLAQFLRNPAQSTTNVHRNGVRPYLAVRMPTFSLSENEIQTLVRFFMALAKQPSPYVKPQHKPLTAEEKRIARGILRNDCVKCHASGDMEVFPKEIIAPNLGFAGARLNPSWVARWVVKPSAIFPGTNMPDGLFKYNETVKRFTIDTKVEGLDLYSGDHRDLIVNYLMELNEAEAELLRSGK